MSTQAVLKYTFDTADRTVYTWPIMFNGSSTAHRGGSSLVICHERELVDPLDLVSGLEREPVH